MDWFAESAAGGGKRRLPPTTGVVVKLTPAEAAVAAAAARGLSNKEVARLLGKQVGTVKNQLSAIYRKLAVKSRAHLIVMLRG
jgi:DNA-binding NarL/FixJ family response regulator